MLNTLSFPGLGIGEFTVDTVATNILGKDITWYGIIITTGIIAGFFYALKRSKFENIKTDDVLDLAIYCIIAAIIGARAYYVLTNLDSYDNFYDIIAIWNGGIAIYGAIIAGAITTFIVAKVKKIKVGRMFDMISPAVMLGQVIGRWGNFLNAEAFGTETTLPWRMGIQNRYHVETVYVHPTFIYESLWNLTGFLIINALYKKKRFDGQIFLMYITWYGFGRMFIEGLRTDSLYIFGDIRISQLVGLLSFAVGTALLIVLTLRSASKAKCVGPSNENIYDMITDETASAVTANKGEDTGASGKNSGQISEKQDKQDKNGGS